MISSLITILENMKNSAIIKDRECASEFLVDITKHNKQLGSCDKCKWVSEDLRSCNNPKFSDCDIFINSLFEPK